MKKMEKLETCLGQYRNLLDEHGADSSKAFGHGMWQGCFRRYAAACQVTDLTGKRVLDIGCATGWLVPFAIGAGVKHYVGVDVTPEMIHECNERWGFDHDSMGDRVDVRFCITDFSMGDQDPQFIRGLQFPDVVFCLGVGVGNLQDPVEFMLAVMNRAWLFAKEAVVFSQPYGNFASDLDLLEMAQSISGRVVLRRDYWGPDQMVYMYK